MIHWLQKWAAHTELSSQRLFRVFWLHALSWYFARMFIQWMFGLYVPLEMMAWAAFFVLIYYSIAASINTEFQIRGQKDIF
ncbi:MAG TPA: hypothetical protein VFF04_01785 [Candidatus Babeliales bacterium]|nr:hypothetical protein [Candidatus Babeliales bacterium]